MSNSGIFLRSNSRDENSGLSSYDKLKKENVILRAMCENFFVSNQEIMEIIIEDTPMSPKLFIAICRNGGYNFKDLISSGKITKDICNSYDDNKSCLYYLNILGDYKNINLVLDLLSQDTFNKFDINSVLSCDVMRVLINSKLMTQEKFNTININYYYSKNGDILSMLLMSKFMTQEIFNEISFNSHNINKKIVLESKFMTQDIFDMIEIDSSIFRPLFNDEIKTNGKWRITTQIIKTLISEISTMLYYQVLSEFEFLINNKYINRELFELLSKKLFNYSTFVRFQIIDRYIPVILDSKHMTKDFFDNEFTKFIISINNDYSYIQSNLSNYIRKDLNSYRIRNTNVRKDILRHKFINRDLFINSLQDILDDDGVRDDNGINIEGIDFILSHKFVDDDLLLNHKIYICDAKKLGPSLKPLFHAVKERHINDPFFISKLGDKSLDKIYDYFGRGKKLARLFYGNKFYEIRDKYRKAVNTICKFMYNSYFGPNGIFYQKQLEKIDD